MVYVMTYCIHFASYDSVFVIMHDEWLRKEFKKYGRELKAARRILSKDGYIFEYSDLTEEDINILGRLRRMRSWGVWESKTHIIGDEMTIVYVYRYTEAKTVRRT